MADKIYDALREETKKRLKPRTRQARLAEKLGVTPSQINDFKTGRNDANPQLRRQIAAELGINYDAIVNQGSPGIPVISYVSAGKSFQWTDQGYTSGDGFDFIDLPPGAKYSPGLYAVRVKGDSMRPLYKDGATFIVKPESREEITHEDIVVWKDEDYNAWVKMVLFHENQIIFRSLNSQYPDIVKKSDEIILMDKVIATVY